MDVSLTLNSDQHLNLVNHLFPGDGLEAAAFILCGRLTNGKRCRLVGREIHPIPYNECLERSEGRITWSNEVIVPILEKAEKESLSVIKIHSHPTGFPNFSSLDDKGDAELIPAIRGWIEQDILHGSAIMLPDGRIFGRYLTINNSFSAFEFVNIAGDDLQFWYSEPLKSESPEFAASHIAAFGDSTFERLKRLSIAVIGCSGTGSPVIEQLTRLGVGKLVLVDDDIIKKRNVNRILNSTMNDARCGHKKVNVMADIITRMGLGTKLEIYDCNLWDSPKALKAVASCDLVFGCMDSIDGRFLLNTLSTFYLLPYFDLGVVIDAIQDGPDQGKIREVCGSVHYIVPGGSSLINRGLFTMKQVADAGLARTDPQNHSQQVKDGYISDFADNKPAVISLNMQIASLAVNSFLARLQGFNEEPNRFHRQIEVSLTSMEIFTEEHATPCPFFIDDVGKGDQVPLLGLPQLSESPQC